MDENHCMHAFRSMGVIEPGLRATAAQMLVLLFNGNGFTTPRNQVSPLPPLPEGGSYLGRLGSP